MRPWETRHAYDATARLSASQSAVYADPAQLQRERERIFPHTWLPACGLWRLRRPGDYVVLDELDRSVLVMRGERGLHAFYNACRHRGARLLEGRGRVRAIRCPYHGWRYDTDGRLATVPLATGFKEERPEGLRRVRVDQWAGLAWVCEDPEAPSLAEALGATLHEELLPYRLEEMVPVQDTIITLHVNWKAFLENVTDFYHVPYVHGRSIGRAVDQPPDLLSYGDHTRQRLSVAGSGWRSRLDRHCSGPGDFTERQLAELHKYIVFPNVCLNVLPYHLTVMAVWPVDANTTRLHYAFCRRQGTSPLARGRAWATWAASRYILWEDIDILRRFQEGVRTTPPDRQPLHDQESAASHLQAVVARWVEGA